MNFTIFLFFRKNEKTPETLDFTHVSGGVFGVPEVIRTPDLPLRKLNVNRLCPKSGRYNIFLGGVCSIQLSYMDVSDI